MSSAILLQVGYAANVSQSHPIVNTGGFDVYFENPVTSEASEQVEVVVNEKGNTLDIKVQNLYPGAEFNIETHIKNNGNISAQVKDIKLHSTQTDTSKDLMDMLVGYGTSGDVYGGEESYNSYLQKTYQGHQLDKGDSMPLKFKLGMNPEIENLQNETVEFSIQISLEQVINSGGGGGSSGGGSDPDTDIENPDTDLPEETIPGGGITIPEITVPEIDLQEETIPGGATAIDVNVPDEGIPGGAVTNLPGGGMLPKTGGIAPTLVYTIGFAMLAGGLVVYRKKDKE